MAKDQDDLNENVVIVFFANEDKAKDSIDGLKQWDKANDHMKLGAIGTITKDGDKIKTHAGRKTGKGAVIGATVGVIGAVLTGGALLGAAIGLGATGGVLGAFFKKSMQLTEDEISAIGTELDGGKVAVVVNCDEDEIEPTTDYLTASGGTGTRVYRVPTEALEEAAGAVIDSVESDED